MQSERVEIVSKANVRHLFIELMSTKRYVKPFLHCILTVMNNEEVLEFQDLASFFTIATSIYNQLKTAAPK